MILITVSRQLSRDRNTTAVKKRRGCCARCAMPLFAGGIRTRQSHRGHEAGRGMNGRERLSRDRAEYVRSLGLLRHPRRTLLTSQVLGRTRRVAHALARHLTRAADIRWRDIRAL